MSWLSLVGASGGDSIVVADGDIQFLFQISIVVSEEQAEAPILVMKPSFEDSRNALPGIVRRSHQQLLCDGQPGIPPRNHRRQTCQGNSMTAHLASLLIASGRG